MTRITLREHAPDYESPSGTWPGTFARDAFASQIGKTVPLTVEGGHYVSATLASAEVAADGSYAELTFDVPDEPAASLSQIMSDRPAMSFGFHAPDRFRADTDDGFERF